MYGEQSFKNLKGMSKRPPFFRVLDIMADTSSMVENEKLMECGTRSIRSEKFRVELGIAWLIDKG